MAQKLLPAWLGMNQQQDDDGGDDYDKQWLLAQQEDPNREPASSSSSMSAPNASSKSSGLDAIYDMLNSQSRPQAAPARKAPAPVKHKAVLPNRAQASPAQPAILTDENGNTIPNPQAVNNGLLANPNKSAEVDDKHSTQEVEAEPGLLSKTNYLRAKTREDEDPVLQDQARGIQDSQRAVANYAGMPSQVNLQSLLALTDAWTGSNFAKTYKQPQTPEDKMHMVAKLQDALQKERQGLSKDDIDFIRSQIGGISSLKTVDQDGNTLKSGTFNPNPGGRGKTDQDPIKFARYERAKRADPILRAASSGIDELNKAHQLLVSNTPVSAQNFKFQLLHAFGLGARISNFELQNEMGDPSLGGKFSQYVEKLNKGDLSEGNRGQYLDLVDSLLHELGPIQARQVEHWRSTGKNGFEAKPGAVDADLNSQYMPRVPAPPPTLMEQYMQLKKQQGN